MFEVKGMGITCIQSLQMENIRVSIDIHNYYRSNEVSCILKGFILERTSAHYLELPFCLLPTLKPPLWPVFSESLTSIYFYNKTDKKQSPIGVLTLNSALSP